MDKELSVNATVQNQMAGLLELHSESLTPGASWLQPPPSQIAGNSDATFSAAGAAALSGTVVYMPSGSSTPLTFTFSVDGSDNTAQATYPMIGPTVVARITQGASATATYSYAR